MNHKTLTWYCPCGVENRFRVTKVAPKLNCLQRCSQCSKIVSLEPIKPGDLPTWSAYNRTRRIVEAAHRAITRIGETMTLRQLFYQLVSSGDIPKTEREYDKLCDYLKNARWAGVIGWDLISDETRIWYKMDTYTGLKDALDHWNIAYRRDLWTSKKIALEIWIEKVALAGIFTDVTYDFDVPLLPVRGFNSLSMLHASAEKIRQRLRRGIETYIYYFGDYDPSGKSISEACKRTLKEMAAPCYFERVAIQEWQIGYYNLPVRPTKASDSRSKNWQGGSVELDALTPGQLKQMASSCIEKHITLEEIDQIRAFEEQERKILADLQSGL